MRRGRGSCLCENKANFRGVPNERDLLGMKKGRLLRFARNDRNRVGDMAVDGEAGRGYR